MIISISNYETITKVFFVQVTERKSTAFTVVKLKIFGLFKTFHALSPSSTVFFEIFKLFIDVFK